MIKFVKGPVTFTQKIKPTDASEAITGYLTFMTCDDSRCLPPTDIDFVIFPDKNSGLLGADASKHIAMLAGKSESGISTGGTSAEISPTIAGLYPAISNNVNIDSPKGNCTDEAEEAPKGFWNIFVLGFLGGLIALLTPCLLYTSPSPRD